MSERSIYSERYRTPSPHFPQKTATTLARLLASWERLRELDVHGYRTSKASPPSTWLVDIDWGDRSTHRSPGRGTTCSPFVAQASAMAFSEGPGEPYTPRLAGGTPLPFLFSQLANGVLRAGVPAYERALAAVGATLADNEWPRPVILFNMGHAVEPTELRRGDCVHIDWQSGGGHAVFCWDVHLNERGEVDAFLYLSANGRMAGGGSGGGIAVGGTTDGSGGFIRRIAYAAAAANAPAAEPPRYAAVDPPLFRDSPRYVEEGRWVTWDPAVASRPLPGLRSKTKKRPLLVKRVKAARFHGVDVAAIPLYAMGQDEPGPFVLPAPGSAPTSEAIPPETTRASEELTVLQQLLQRLAGIGWIDPGPGKIDGKMGKRTRASLVAFQRAYGLPEDGEPSALVLERLRSVCESARDAPAARASAPATSGPVAFGGDGPAEPGASILHLYFRHGAGRPGEQVAVIARGCPLPGGPASCALVEESGRIVATVETELAGERAEVELAIPRLPPGTRLHARLSGAGGASLSTAAPLTIARTAPPLSLSEPAQITPRLLRLEEAIAEVLLGDRSLRAIAAAAGLERDELLRCALRYSEAGRLALTRPDEPAPPARSPAAFVEAPAEELATEPE